MGMGNLILAFLLQNRLVYEVFDDRVALLQAPYQY
jgi:Txe/YoeB family toxin of Txe-Axe toxin-antitoxin module